MRFPTFAPQPSLLAAARADGERLIREHEARLLDAVFGDTRVSDLAQQLPYSSPLDIANALACGLAPEQVLEVGKEFNLQLVPMLSKALRTETKGTD